jgi:hypothetical protein
LEGLLRLAEVLGAVSLTTDLGAGVPFEKLADVLQLEREDR